MQTSRRFLWILPAAMLVAGAGIASYVAFSPTHTAASVGGPFTLVDGDGKTVTDRSLLGHWTLIYFGYTHCPDACPTALQDMAGAVDALPPEQRAKVKIVFITVDPERDTPKVMKEYVSNFDAPIAVMSGSAEQVAKAAHGYRVFYAKHKTADGYEMDHSSIIYVMDPQGEFVANFTHQSAPKDITKRLGALIG